MQVVPSPQTELHPRPAALRRRGMAWNVLASLAATFFLALSFAAHANEAESDPEAPGDRHYEVWAGADAGDTFWLLYSGTTLAPFGDIHATGLRARLVSGYGQYRYASFDTKTLTAEDYRAETTFADALVGYLWRLDPLILKLFAGVSYVDHRIHPFDANNHVQGPAVGFKGVAEFWFNLSDNAFAAIDLSWSQAHRTRSARGRLGYRLTPNLSLGPEAGFNMDRQGDYKVGEEHLNFRTEPMDYARLGAFARYEWFGGEVSASAGFIGDFREERSAYATLNWISQF